MTAEVVVINHEAVAFAADSAVTASFGDPRKVFQTANKVFTLSARHPVGVMVYGVASFLGVPWEAWIKDYRRLSGPACFATVRQHAADFFRWIETVVTRVPDDDRQSCAHDIVRETMEAIVDALKQETNSRLRRTPMSGVAVRDCLAMLVSQVHGQLAGRPALFDAEACADIHQSHLGLVQTVMRETLERLPLTPDSRKQVEEIGLHALTSMREPTSPTLTNGLVFAGFGDEQLLPEMLNFRVEGAVGGRVRLILQDHARNGEPGIFSLAQDEGMRAILGGISPERADHEQKILSQLRAKILAGVDEALPRSPKAAGRLKATIDQEIHAVQKDLQTTRTQPALMSMLRNLPKVEVSQLAEALVQIVVLQRRMSHGPETVGGPVDVALISKGDGFIWIRRKHYFPRELNEQFFQNRAWQASGPYRGARNGDEEI